MKRASSKGLDLYRAKVAKNCIRKVGVIFFPVEGGGVGIAHTGSGI